MTSNVDLSMRIFLSAFRNAPFGKVIVGMDGYPLHVNNTMVQILGYTEAELLNLSIFEYIRFESSNLIEQIRNSPNGFIEIDRRISHQNGREIHALISVSQIESWDGYPQLFIIHFQDISKMKRMMFQLEMASLALRESEAKYRLLADHSLDMITSIWPDGRLNYISHACRHILGYEPGEMIGMKAIEFIHPDDLEFIIRPYWKQTREQSRIEFRVCTKNEGYIWVEAQSKKLRDPSTGNVTKVVSVIRDITERKLYEAELAHSEVQYRHLVEQSPDAVLIGTPTRWIYANETAVKLIGAASKEELLASDPRTIYHPDYLDVIEMHYATTQAGKPTDLTEVKLIRMDGSVMEAEIKSIPTYFQGKSCIHTLIRDITERKKAQYLLGASEKLNVAGQLAAGIAHEIRNPLTSLKGFVQLIRNDGVAKPHFLEIMMDEINRIELIVSELLMLSKPHNGQPLVPRNVIDILGHVVALMDTQAILNSITIDAAFDEENLTIKCDENRLKQVFINIVKNAIESMPNGGTIRIHASRQDQSAIIRIQDQGGGIPQEVLDRLGEPFFTTKEKGTGLGLMVTRKIVENHSGQMHVESTVGEGTMIELRFPICEP